MKEKLLEGIRIADFTWVLTGPLVTKAFSDFGAEVIKIEGANTLDLFRKSVPFKDGVPGVNRGGRLNWSNTGKLSLALDLAQPRAIEVARNLIARSDVVVENFSGGAMERMGLGYEELRKVKPDIIMLSACMQGQTGPHAAHPGFGNQLTALSGFDTITGWPDRDPVPLGAYTDHIAPHLNIMLVLAALDYRRRTGRGQYFDLSQYEAAVHFMAPLLLDYVVNHRVAGRMGNRSVDAAPHGAYRCRGEDTWCVIAVVTDEEWAGFANVIGNPPWTRHQDFAAFHARKEHEDELDRLVETWTVNHEADDVMRLMQAAGVSAGIVRDVREILECDPQLQHRRSYRELTHPEVGKHIAPGPSFALSRSSGEVGRAPLLGEHNEYVCKEILHMSDDEIADLVIQGVLE